MGHVVPLGRACKNRDPRKRMWRGRSWEERKWRIERLGKSSLGMTRSFKHPLSDSLSCLKACAHKHTHSHLDTCSQHRPVLKAKGGR